MLLGSGAIGFFLGAVRQPTWHDAIEPAQVLAGIVQYPPDNPVYLYSTHTWTVLHQICAALLRAGLSERALTLMLSGWVGLLSLQALAVIIFTLSDDVALAILGPFVIYFTDATVGGITYPLDLMGSTATYGVVALSYLMLTLALLGAGQIEWGALLLGFGPAVHPAVGVWAIVIVAVVAAVERTAARAWLRRAAPYFVAGITLCIISAVAYHVHRGRTTPGQYASAVVQHWNDHRWPFPLLRRDPFIVVATATLAALWLSRFRDDVPVRARMLLRLLLVALVVGAVMSASYWIVPPDVPNVIAWSMPSRLLNVGLFAWMALLVGLSARYRRNILMQANLAALIVVTCLDTRASEERRFAVTWAVMAASTIALVVSAECNRRGLPPPRTFSVATRWLRPITLSLVSALLVAVIVRTVSQSTIRRLPLVDRTNDAALASAAAGSGLLLTGSDLHLIQLTTRRPVLLDGLATDGLVYVPEAAPETARIMRRVYGVDLEALERTGGGGFEPDTGKTLWQERTRLEWQAIAKEFGVTDVLTYPDWKLQLPLLAQSEQFALFEIPR